ncbi:bifunctional DNA primase/polymerase [Saccharothrix australiensis]|uniref:Bifunctional DNA primase/polymerase-like protein n=1 Tax=Saccharothrix australiensis TaxID=2072 RepID=A0A495VSU8_9PSEU|nr:bifunctional DNA primase/polymerase [Saccharothrix australiensis]RKT52471.1 bifunctional DNA primase/polymerase-like protein [Saccharothrix australiensis]
MPGTETDCLPVDENLRAALDYAAMGWPVIPGAAWDGGRFVDPATGRPVDQVRLHPVAEATTDVDVVRRWWGAPGGHVPAVLVVTGPSVGVVSIREDQARTIVGHAWFRSRPTPVAVASGLPVAFFLVRPPNPPDLTRDDVRVFTEGSVLPLPPTTVATISTSWLVSPEECGRVLLPAAELAELLTSLEGTTS